MEEKYFPQEVIAATEEVLQRNFGQSIADLFKRDRHRELVDRRRCVVLTFVELTGLRKSNTARYFDRCVEDLRHLHDSAIDLRSQNGYFRNMQQQFKDAVIKSINTNR